VNQQRRLAASPFPGDDGAASIRTRQWLQEAATGQSPTGYLRALAELCTDRLLVPVVATVTREGQTIGGLHSDKEAEMAVVLLQTAAGSRALLAFTGQDSLHAWRPDSRPVPVTLDLAAQSAVAEGCSALLIDVAGPHPLAIESDVLTELAAGHRLVEVAPEQFGWAVQRC
jgi:SseB protein N-terminal domain